MGLGKNYVRGHNRQKGGASALAALGLSHYQLRIAGRWAVGTTERYVEAERKVLVEYQRLAIVAALNRFKAADLHGFLPKWWIDEVRIYLSFRINRTQNGFTRLVGIRKGSQGC